MEVRVRELELWMPVFNMGGKREPLMVFDKRSDTMRAIL